jgi:hypothetical protein
MIKSDSVNVGQRYHRSDWWVLVDFSMSPGMQGRFGPKQSWLNCLCPSGIFALNLSKQTRS